MMKKKKKQKLKKIRQTKSYPLIINQKIMLPKYLDYQKMMI